MKTFLAVLSLVFLTTAFFLGCQKQGSDASGPEVLNAKGGKGGGGKQGFGNLLKMDWTAGDWTTNPADSPTLTTSETALGVHNTLYSGPIVINTIRPKGSSKDMKSVLFSVKMKAGKLVSVHLWFSEAEEWSSAGPLYQTPVVALQDPVAPSAGGFTLHVDADNVPLRLENAKKNATPIGTISIGDVVYRPKNN